MSSPMVYFRGKRNTAVSARALRFYFNYILAPRSLLRSHFFQPLQLFTFFILKSSKFLHSHFFLSALHKSFFSLSNNSSLIQSTMSPPTTYHGPLRRACEKGELQTMRDLILGGAKASSTDKSGVPCITLACAISVARSSQDAAGKGC